jgi:hypothetical protein
VSLVEALESSHVPAAASLEQIVFARGRAIPFARRKVLLVFGFLQESLLRKLTGSRDILQHTRTGRGFLSERETPGRGRMSAISHQLSAISCQLSAPRALAFGES